MAIRRSAGVRGLPAVLRSWSARRTCDRLPAGRAATDVPGTASPTTRTVAGLRRRLVWRGVAVGGLAVAGWLTVLSAQAWAEQIQPARALPVGAVHELVHAQPPAHAKPAHARQAQADKGGARARHHSGPVSVGALRHGMTNTPSRHETREHAPTSGHRHPAASPGTGRATPAGDALVRRVGADVASASDSAGHVTANAAHSLSAPGPARHGGTGTAGYLGGIGTPAGPPRSTDDPGGRLITALDPDHALPAGPARPGRLPIPAGPHRVLTGVSSVAGTGAALPARAGDRVSPPVGVAPAATPTGHITTATRHRDAMTGLAGRAVRDGARSAGDTARRGPAYLAGQRTGIADTARRIAHRGGASAPHTHRANHGVPQPDTPAPTQPNPLPAPATGAGQSAHGAATMTTGPDLPGPVTANNAPSRGAVPPAVRTAADEPALSPD